jgi:predicted DNA-binding antitoxin AbrB/MazE fold protein
MAITVDAVWEGGVLRPARPLDLPDKTHVHVTIESEEPARTPLGARLREIREQILSDPNTPLVESWDGVEREVAAIRGGWPEEP